MHAGVVGAGCEAVKAVGLVAAHVDPDSRRVEGQHAALCGGCNTISASCWLLAGQDVTKLVVFGDL